MKAKPWILLVCIFCSAAALMAAPQTRKRQTPSDEDKMKSAKEVYTGTLVAIGGRFGGRSTPFTLILNDYTDPADEQRYISILKSGGQDDLLDAIRKKDLGSFQIGAQIGRDINYATETETEDGRKITLLFERWIEFFELRFGTRSRDYPFTYVELFIDDAKRKGEGAMIPAARVRYKGEKTIEVENFGAWPVRLMGVVRRKK